MAAHLRSTGQSFGHAAGLLPLLTMRWTNFLWLEPKFALPAKAGPEGREKRIQYPPIRRQSQLKTSPSTTHQKSFTFPCITYLTLST